MKDSGQVLIEPRPRYVGRQDGQYAFAYTIRITNRSDRVITLEDRHWVITHGDGRAEVVRGPGVVGEHPRLAPGQHYEYTSGALIPTATGSMKGSYGFRTDEGERFRATIPEFALHAPDALH